jgi:predicted deacylase
MRLLCILVVVGIVLAVYAHLYYVSHRLDVVVLDAEMANKHPTVVIVGGTHGNEPAGSRAIEELIASGFRPKRGKVVCIPRANPLGLMLNMRWIPTRLWNRDMNRNYPTEDGEMARDALSAEICRVVEGADFVVDLHEGWGFHHKQPNSMGSGLYPNSSTVATQLSYDIQRGMNENVVVMESAEDTYKQFVVELGKHPQLKSLKGFCEWKGIPYILVETSGQNDIQPMDVRKRQHLYVIYRVLKEYQMM